MNLKKTQETFKKKTSFQVPVTIIIISCATNDRILVTVFFYIFFVSIFYTPAPGDMTDGTREDKQ